MPLPAPAFNPILLLRLPTPPLIPGRYLPAGVITAGQGTTAITAVSTAASGTITVLAGNACLAAPAGSTLAVNSLTAPVLPNGPAAVCASSTGNVYSIPAVAGATSYTWSVPAGWAITTGQGTNAITVTAAAGNTGGNISVQASNGCQTGGGAPLAVTGGSLTPSVIVVSNTGNTICQGTVATFTATAFNGGTAPFYQWKKNGVNVGANSLTYSVSNLVNGDAVSVALTSSVSCPTVATVTGFGPPLTVVPNVMPTVTINGPSAVTLCAGAIATFTSSVTAGGPNATYQWYKNGMAITGQTASGYTGFGFANGDSVYVVLTPTVACKLADTVRSSSVLLNVYPNVVPAVTVTAVPGTAVPAGTAVTFTANITAGSAGATYQWYKNGTAVTGATGSTYTSSALVAGDLISVRVANLGPCANPTSLTSESVRMSAPAGIQAIGGGSGNWTNSLVLSPNPNRGRFLVSANWGAVAAGEQVGVAVVNGLGQVVWSRNVALDAGTWQLEVELEAGVANGLYLLRVQRQKDGSGVAKSFWLQR